MKGAIYVSDSGNTKIMGSRKVDATYTSILHSCPDTCDLKDKGCYAKLSYVGMVNYRNERRARGASPLEIARYEAKAIDDSYNGKKVPEGRFLRLHVAGDCRVRKGADLINNAIKRWLNRGGERVWSYTHAWMNVPKSRWSNVSMLASVDNVSQVAEARNNGYAPAIVVPEFTSDKAFKLDGCDTKWIPCPAQTRKVGCSDCKLCMRSDWLYQSNTGIAFEAHGAKRNSLKRHLTVING